MKNFFLKTLAVLLAFSGLIGFSSLTIAPAFAEGEDKATSDVCKSSAAAEVKRAAGCFGNADSIRVIVQTILNSIIAVIGIVAVIFIVIGGVNYMTSQGDPGKLKKAKDTILYACIGLVVCALAFAIVNWTIGILNNAGKSQKPNEGNDEKTSLLLDSPLA